jgi:hypothetical protein
MFFSKIDSYKVHSYKKKKIPIYPVTPLLANFVKQCFPQNQSPWHDMLTITGLGTRFWLRSGMGASLAHATTSQNCAFVFPRGKIAATATLFQPQQ